MDEMAIERMTRNIEEAMAAKGIPDYMVGGVLRYVLYGAAFMGLVPAFFFWRCSLRLNEELDRAG